MSTEPAFSPAIAVDSITSPAKSLARRYAISVGVITLLLLLVSGSLEMVFGYRESRELIARLQIAQADTAAREIDQYLKTIEQGVRDATKLPWGRPGFGLGDKREEYHRLMTLQAALVELKEFDAQDREQLLCSRIELDRLQSNQLAVGAELQLLRDMPQASARQAARYGPILYRDGAAPHTQFAISDFGPAHTTTIATINLRFLADVVSGLRVGEQGHVWVVDAANRVIAHPQASQVLRQLDAGALAPVQAARAAMAASAVAQMQAMDSVGLSGGDAIITAVPVPAPGWLVFVEQPRSEALRPALATLTRTLVLVALGGVLALLASVAYARRMARPIVDLSRAAQRLAAGDLDARIQAPTGDEIEQLADNFNHMADRLQESYKGLEDKVAARTAELSDARDSLQQQTHEVSALNAQLNHQIDELARAKEQAERASAAKTRFLAAASHDLRQPMHTIGLLVGVLRDRLTDREQLALADNAQRSVAVMGNLFSSLLDISKLDAGAVQPALQDVVLDNLLEQTERLYGPLATARGLQLRMRPLPGSAAQGAVMVRSDPAMLERMLGNLVSNAIRYTRRGGVLVAARARGDQVALQVFDTGVGIADAHLDEVFEEFVRLNPTVQDDAKGLGLGLSIVRRSADLLGHRLRVRSVPGRGSMFEIRLPRSASTWLALAPSMPMAPADSAALAGAFVLVVDDDSDNRQALETLCTQWGCSVLAARSAADATQQLQQHLRAPDLIITDYRLGPEGDGFGVLAAVREAVDEAVPAILVTADTLPALAQRAADAHALLVHKPATADELLRAALAALQQGTADGAGS